MGKSSKTKRKIRLIIPRKRKLKEIESAKSISTDCKHKASHPPKLENEHEPPTKKQKLSLPQQPLNEIKACNHPKPQPLEQSNKPISASLPPPPPLQNLSPPPSASSNVSNPYSFLQSQLQTHYQWPKKNEQGMDYTHVCNQCGQGFMSMHDLNVHKQQHKRSQDQIIGEKVGENTYYYPNNHNLKTQSIPKQKIKKQKEEKTEKKKIKNVTKMVIIRGMMLMVICMRFFVMYAAKDLL